MTDQELMDALSGLFAYDSGATDSGIHDEELRARVIEEIRSDAGQFSLFGDRVSRLAREMFLTDEAIDEGYGLEDVQLFANWLDDYMWPAKSQ